MPEMHEKSMEELVALCKRRGFIYPASEIYGGINGFWDYGPLGTQLKNNLRDAWWEAMVLNPPPGPDGERLQIVGLDSSIIQNPKVWEASGHVGGFNDPMVDDKETKGRFRADHLQGVYYVSGSSGETEQIASETYRDYLANWKGQPGNAIPAATVIASSEREALTIFADDKKLQKTLRLNVAATYVFEDPLIAVSVLDLSPGNRQGAVVTAVPATTLEEQSDKVPSPFTGKPGSLTPPRQFNLMFQTYVGALQDEDNKAYLRPETAQGIFINFKNVVDTTRVKVPFGIAQTGKAFRNEVTPRNYIFRSREFEQMEMEWFCHPDDARKWYDFWQQARLDWWKSVGLSDGNLQLRQHERDELAHYAREGAGTADIEFRYPFTAPGYGELEGVAHRSDFDLRQHEEHSGQKMSYFDQEKNERFIPHVIEPAAGLSRGVLALLCDAFTPDPDRPSKVYLKLHPRMSPIKAAVFPLVNKDGMPEKADELATALRRRFGARGFIESDPKQSIGKRYARMDEAGCPCCFTIDGQTLEDGTVTVRDRDTAQQDRINIAQVPRFLDDKLAQD